MNTQMHPPTPAQTPKRIATFFYGSFVRRDVMALGDFHPESVEVAKLHGHDIAFDPHANVFRSSQHAICGILVYPTHQELGRLYARDGVGVFLPEAVVVETGDHRWVPALCYMPPSRGSESPDLPYVERLIQAGQEHGFPAWYLRRLDEVRSGSGSRRAEHSDTDPPH
jgi:hypothetical protein